MCFSRPLSTWEGGREDDPFLSPYSWLTLPPSLPPSPRNGTGIGRFRLAHYKAKRMKCLPGTLRLTDPPSLPPFLPQKWY